jgi:hypothetical protein
MTARRFEQMVVRIAANMSEDDLRAILQDIVELATQEFPQMSDELYNAIARAKVALDRSKQ